MEIPDSCGPNALYWLGQAGFWLDLFGSRVLIDPYLSNSLGEKYENTEFPHIRMVEVPVTPQELPRPDVVLITHAHGDHMDSQTLRPLCQRFPDLEFVVPASEEDVARQKIGTNANLCLANTDDVLDLNSRLRLTVFPASHEERKKDSSGNGN